MTKAELEKNWIISTAMIAFASALLLERSWQESNRSSELTPWVFWVLTAISLILIAVIMVPLPNTMRQLVLKLTDRILSVPLSLAAMIAFFVGWWPPEFELRPPEFEPSWWMQIGGIFIMLMLILNLVSAIRKVANKPWWYWVIILLAVLLAILYVVPVF